MPEKLGVIEAIEKTAQTVDSYKKDILEDARIFSMKVSPETTPDSISNYRQVIGTSKHFRDIRSAAEEIDEELTPSETDFYFDIATFLEIYQYLYLVNGKENPAEVYSGRNESMRLSTANVISSIEESLKYWEKADRTEGFAVSPEPSGEVIHGMNLLCMYYFPKEDIPKVESRIEKDLEKEDMEVDPELLEKLKEFPEQFNLRTAHYKHQNRLDFFYTYTHEFSHAYIRENTPEKDIAFNEATAQFISRYLEAAGFDEKGIRSKSRLEGLKFENSPEKYAGYDDQYYSGASEDIYVIVEFMKLRAAEKIQSNDLYDSQNFHLVDWLIEEEIKAVNKCKEENGTITKKGVLRHYIPVELQQEIKEVNQVIENEINPLISDIRGFMDELEKYKDFHYHELVNKVNDILKEAVNQEMGQQEFKNYLEEEGERRSKLHQIERRVKKDLKKLRKIEKKDHLELDQIYEVVENLPEDPDPAAELEKIKEKARPGKTEMEELKEDISDLEELKNRVEEERDKSIEEMSEISHQGYSIGVRELEQEEVQTVNRLVDRLETLQKECRKVREDLENI